MFATGFCRMIPGFARGMGCVNWEDYVNVLLTFLEIGVIDAVLKRVPVRKAFTARNVPYSHAMVLIVKTLAFVMEEVRAWILELVIAFRDGQENTAQTCSASEFLQGTPQCVRPTARVSISITASAQKISAGICVRPFLALVFHQTAPVHAHHMEFVWISTIACVRMVFQGKIALTTNALGSALAVIMCAAHGVTVLIATFVPA
mmetsp:Transcript_3908/g.14761  ORF Transcript_3908/g.14761 Transcript_3908/m.14761 type:complete len:204 (+) Transcript_3908:3179-3790(+)